MSLEHLLLSQNPSQVYHSTYQTCPVHSFGCARTNLDPPSADFQAAEFAPSKRERERESERERERESERESDTGGQDRVKKASERRELTNPEPNLRLHVAVLH